MIRICFPDTATEQRALGYLAGRFSFKTYSNGETLVPAAALASWRLRAFVSPPWDQRTMSSTLRRFEILLPLRFNDGQPVPDELIGQTILELRQQFKAISAETQVIRGYWQSQGEDFRDELVRLFIDVADNAENHAYFVQFKEQMKARFRQLDVWMTAYLIEVI